MCHIFLVLTDSLSMLVKKCVIVNMWLNVREIKQIAYSACYEAP